MIQGLRMDQLYVSRSEIVSLWSLSKRRLTLQLLDCFLPVAIEAGERGHVLTNEEAENLSILG
jgi:hypothetical protein